MQVTVNIATPTQRTYTVRGNTLREAHGRLPRGCWGRYAGNFTWDYRGRNGMVSHLILNAAPVITLPRWHGRGRASREEQREWDRMLRALTAHEDAHHEVLVNALEDQRHFFSDEPDTAVRQLRQDLGSYGSELQQYQDDFDRTSRHGQRAGVVLNFPD
ncbi:hypothetical protein LNKW23_17010 [Paralimibaculum aggregatum]|uniref:DUF922 domain-containing protein n=1 Tax=Paralimibaculum aggregatum TaxID=3036245 RepID=A0ABQ6LGR2_9RHOB|nr:DUF922 domain-containing protein [Limibaculum sp. NKW23]GMG82488.1 hypothetical protein LNKW23_17010 [Limibaculum sp. NKW23]